MDDDNDNLSPVTAFVIVTTTLVVSNLPSSARTELWNDPFYRMLLMAIPVGLVVPNWHDALLIFLVVWFIEDVISELHEDSSFHQRGHGSFQTAPFGQ
jgi:hypothetical protein